MTARMSQDSFKDWKEITKFVVYGESFSSSVLQTACHFKKLIVYNKSFGHLEGGRPGIGGEVGSLWLDPS